VNGSGIGDNRGCRVERLKVHREVAAVTRRLGETATGVVETNREGIESDEAAGAIAPLAKQTVAAQE
jgi:hypothetical protein